MSRFGDAMKRGFAAAEKAREAKLGLRLQLLRRHLRSLLWRFVTSSFEDLAMADARAELERALEERLWLEVERDYYREAIHDYVDNFTRRSGPGGNVSPWAYLVRFEEILREGLYLRARPPAAPSAPEAPKGAGG